MANNQEGFDFSTLVTAIHQVDENMAAQAGRAVNVSLTLRNWMIGAYIDKYELNGSDRTDYGNKLLSELAKRLTGINVSNCNRRQLYRYLRFYRLYPKIVGTVSTQSKIPSEEHDGWRRQAARGHSALHAKRPCPGGIRPGRYGHSHLFVSKYQLEPPRKEEIQKFLEEKMREVGV